MNKDMIITSTIPKGEVKGSVGAGDSMVAGFLATLKQGKSVEEAFRYSVAAGSATAFSVGLCTAAKTESLLQKVILNKISEEDNDQANYRAINKREHAPCPY